MSPALETAFTIGAWILVVLLASIGWWFLRRHHQLHTAVVVVAVLVGAYLVYRLRELMVMLLIAGVLAFILDPLILRLSRRMKRPVAIALVFLGLVAVGGAVGTLLIPRVVTQARGFIQEIPTYSQDARTRVVDLVSRYGGSEEQAQTAIDKALDQAQNFSKRVSGEVERFLIEVLGWAVKSVLILILAIYLLLDKERLREGLVESFPEDSRTDLREVVQELSDVFSSYLRGQGTVILFVAASATIALLALGIPYALFIGFLAGILEVIPYFGALAGALPAVALGFTKSPATGIWVIVAFLVINQLEGHVVIPWVMGANLEMRPLAIFLTLLAGEMLGGVVGMIVAVPAVSLLRVLIPRIRSAYERFRMRERGRAVLQTAGPDPPGT